MWWYWKEISGRPQPSAGEAIVVLIGVNTTSNSMPLGRVTVVADCLLVQSYLISTSSPFVSFCAVLDSYLELCSHFTSLSFVRRSGSALAHSIATSLHCNEGSSIPSSLIE